MTNTGWKIDKRIPVASLGVMLMYGATTIWWVATLDNRIVNLEAKAIKSEPQVEKLIERMIAVEVNVAHVQKTLESIESKIDRRGDK